MRLAIGLLLTVGVLEARGNFGSYSGGWGSEPTGLESIRILSETLTIDLRACDGSELEKGKDGWKQPVGKVEAIYQLLNSGAGREVHLAFAAGVDIEENALSVTLNEIPVKSVRETNSERRWTVPSSTPGIDGSDGHSFSGAYNRVNFSVRLTVPAGPSTLRVLFRTLIGNDRSAVPTCCWQFVYLLAPVRDWGGFDRLDVKVLIPPGWKAASNCQLRREGDVLTGFYDRVIPADALTLTIRMPPEPFEERIVQVRWITLIAIGLSIPTWLFGTRTIGRRFNGRLVRGLLILASGLLWGLGGLAASYFLILYPFQIPGLPVLQRGASGSAIPLIDIVMFFAAIGTLVGTGVGAGIASWILPHSRGTRTTWSDDGIG